MAKPSLVTGAIVLAFTWHAGYDHYQQRRQDVRTIEQRLREEQATQALRGAVARSLEEVGQFRQRLSPARDTEWLVSQVSSFAEEAGIRLSAIVQQEPRKVEGFTHLAVILQFTASYHQLGRFVSRLENAPVFLRVDEMTIGGSSPASGGGSGQAGAPVRMTVSTLYGDDHKNQT